MNRTWALAITALIVPVLILMHENQWLGIAGGLLFLAVCAYVWLSDWRRVRRLRSR